MPRSKAKPMASEIDTEGLLRRNCPLPAVVLAVGALALGDVAVVLTMLFNTGWSY